MVEVGFLSNCKLTQEQIDTVTELTDKASNYKPFIEVVDSSTWELIEYLLNLHDIVLEVLEEKVNA